ncbi:unannotated protein [freshwater metagenome]|uniref:Unannotated protein n=1 Tax=freshwater metagenome TaxID=449393 RepID=A0A6J6EL05_9ZZZZ
MSIRASRIELKGVWDAGFSTTAQPAAIAGPTLCTTRFKGKLNGAMAPTTPIGIRMVNPNFPSPAGIASMATTSPTKVRASTAENRNVPTARSTSTRAVLTGLAASRAMAMANSSRRAANRFAAVSRISALFHAGRGVSIARRAATTARSTSADVHAGTRPMSEPSNGARTSM